VLAVGCPGRMHNSEQTGEDNESVITEDRLKQPLTVVCLCGRLPCSFRRTSRFPADNFNSTNL